MRFWLALAMALSLVVWAGCNSGQNSNPTASINAPGGSSAKPAAKPGPTKEELLHPKVQIDTNLGAITLQLDAEKSPLTVDNFLSYVDSGHYDQTIVHQVIKGHVAIGGGYGTNLTEKRTHTPVRNEAHNGLKNTRGTIAMARQPNAVDSATCQFFFNLADNPWLDHKERNQQGYGYCVFGKVINGMDIVDRIGAANTKSTDQFEQLPTETIAIKSVRRIR